SYPAHPEIVVCQKGFSPQEIHFLETRHPRLRCLDLTTHAFLKGPAMLNRANYDVDPFYARFLIWTELFDGYDNVLYLDIDAFVTGSLEPLFASQEFLCFEESYVGPNPVFFDDTDPVLVRQLREDGLTLPATSGNAGVMLVPRRYRTPEQLALLHRLVERYRQFLVWGDQTLINLWMAANGIRPTKDYRYNFQVRLLQQKREAEAYRAVCFFHMNGWNHLDCVEHLVRTAFFFFFHLPGGRRIYPLYLRLAVRGEMARISRPYQLVMRFTRLFRRRSSRHDRTAPAATTSV
ncbi:MAG TPA: glycosyltransferase, partial [Opitutaceae bacterium]|nr:glycosyltransferase [Opitutaceae bacterium]